MSQVTDPRTATSDGRRRRWDNDKGAVLFITALALPVLILMTAFAIDLGAQRSSRRTMQARADIVALDMVRLADGRTVTQITGDPAYATYFAASATRNNVDVAKLTATWGWVDDTGLFRPRTAAEVPSAVRITAKDSVDYIFRPGTGKTERSAVASRLSEAGFSIGSFAAAVSSGSGPLLNSLIGNALGLGVLSYSGLASNSLTYLGIANELGLATAEELFTTNVSAYDALRASAQILQRDSANAAQVAVLNQVLAVPNSSLRNVKLGDTVKVETGGEQAAAVGQINVFDLLATSAFVANGQSGVSLPATSLNLPGTAVTGSLNLIQHPQTVYGPVGATASTSQAAVTAGFTVGTGSVCDTTGNLLANLLTSVTGLLTALLGAPSCGLLKQLVTVEIKSNLNINLAAATGTIASIACTTADQLGIDVRSDLVRTDLSFSVVVKAGSTTIATVPLAVTAGGGATNGTASFVIPPDQLNVFKPVNPGNGSLGLNTANVTGLGALGSLLLPIVNPLVTSTVNSLNSNLVLPLSNALGVRVAGADVAPRAVTCSNVQLVG